MRHTTGGIAGKLVGAVVVLGLLGAGGWAAWKVMKRPKAVDDFPVTAVGTLDFVALADAPLPAEQNPPLAIHEPATGCYLGAYLDLDKSITDVYKDETGKERREPRAFEKIVGKAHAMYFFYLGYGHKAPLDWLGKLRDANKAVHIALEPNKGLDQVKDDAYLKGLADDLRSSGARMFLRYASEMNGTWTKYSGDPKKYIEKFRLVARIMHERAPNVAMVWCPYTRPVANIPSYYPGDESVDWVGVNMYNVTYFNQNLKTPAMNVSPLEMLNSVYPRYSERKPIMICEYGATHYSAVDDKVVTDFACKSIKTLYTALRKQYTRVKAINYFNINNMTVSHRKNNDYSVTDDPNVLKVYQEVTKSPYFLPKVPKLRLGGKALADGAKVKDGMRLAVRLPEGSTATDVKLKLNGKVAAAAFNGSAWICRLSSAECGAGPWHIQAEALDRRGRTVARGDVELTPER